MPTRDTATETSRTTGAWFTTTHWSVVWAARQSDSAGSAEALEKLVVRHQGRGQLAFADGHVEGKVGSELVTNGLARFPQQPVIWTADPLRNPNTD